MVLLKISSCNCCYRVYGVIWSPTFGKHISCELEMANTEDPIYTVAVMLRSTVGVSMLQILQVCIWFPCLLSVSILSGQRWRVHLLQVLARCHTLQCWMGCICVTCPCCCGLVCVVYITCLSSVVSWAPTWDYHCTLLVQGALFSVPDVWVWWALLVRWCHHKCFHLAITGWFECPTPCCC